jgi:two-component system nitrogen regulation sensor histidine kinase NtrY
LLFLSISIAIRFSSRFFRSINNLIIASADIGKGNLDIKVPEIKTDKDMEILNKNFNLMTEKLKSQQDKLIITERHEAWESLARKLAHEIKNPLTPIQLTIDRLKDKFSEALSADEKSNFTDSLKIIDKQIKQIENLVNEFSDFARMPKPILKDNNLMSIISDNLKLLKTLDENIKIDFINKKNEIFFRSDSEQLSRVFFNLIKNAIESVKEKIQENTNIKGKINIAINDYDDYIEFIIKDNGKGFKGLKNIKEILNPYFTTKKTGTGLGLAIVNKIINDHNGSIKFTNFDGGAKVTVEFLKIK